MPKPYPAEFRARAVALVLAGRRVADVAYDLGISAGGLSNWIRQDRIDRGEIDGRSTTENAELRASRKRIRDLEEEVAILRAASKLLGEDKPHHKGFTR
ncbi:MAG: transposase [Micrococcales bacterium 32-70-13]|nr:MAG: transposase [Micrococcales bacterium 32-70-13]